MEYLRQTVIFAALSIVLMMVGSFGYMIIEGWGFMDSLYMTIITLATVGYGEVNPVGFHGRIFTIILILLGVGFFLYVAGNVIQFLVEGRIRLVLGRRKLDTQINRLRGHYIICGYGRIGRVLARFLIARYIDVVVIERNQNRVPRLDEDDILYIIGDAKDEAVLEKAGIQRAKGIITSVATDADNVFLVIIAKQLNPDLFIVARAEQNSVKKTLLAAGADKVISPYDLGARRMAHAILRPTVIQFLEMAFADDSIDIQIEEIRIKPDSKMAGLTMKDSGIRQKYDLMIMVIRKPDGSMVFNPKADTVMEAGDVMVVVGSAKSIQRLDSVL
ncbi:MAG: potassium channel protein [Desulfobacteraceae bacterium]|nr:potassium channel protein [Desulfobacteraceae bacterium]